MSNLEMRHLEDGQLLRYLDGELTRRKARYVREHLEACWQCRTELEGLQAAVADCVRYRKNVLVTCLPPPPEPWKDLSRGFDRIDSSLAGESLAARLVRILTLRAWTPVKWAAAFAAWRWSRASRSNNCAKRLRWRPPHCSSGRLRCRKSG